MTFAEFKTFVEREFPGADGPGDWSHVAKHTRFGVSIVVAKQKVLMCLERPASFWEINFVSAHGTEKVVDNAKTGEEALRHAAKAVV